MRSPRIYVDQKLDAANIVRLMGERAHYLRNVMRVKPGHTLRLFNATDGEWQAEVKELRRHDASAGIVRQLRSPVVEEGPSLLFAPIRRNRLDWMIEKATELGVGDLQPILTEHTVIELAQPDRLQARIIEAAEQCGRLTIPRIHQPVKLADIGPGPAILFADESGGGVPALRAFCPEAKMRILIGPEGGLSENERDTLLARTDVTAVDLGPLILRSETAALAMLSCWRGAELSSKSDGSEMRRKEINH